MREIILSYVFPVIFLGIGILQTIYPEKTFMFGRRWMFSKEPQLSDISKLFIRIAGVIIILISIWLLIGGI